MKISKTRVLELGGSKKVPLGYTDVFFSISAVDSWFFGEKINESHYFYTAFVLKNKPAKGGEWKNLEQTSPCDVERDDAVDELNSRDYF